MDIKALDNEYIAHSYKRFPLCIVEGKGSIAYDENAKEYIDLATGIAVNSFGYCDPLWQKAVIEQTVLLQHSSNLYYTKPCVELAEMLCKKTGYSKVFFSNSGAEANECAIKLARKYSADKYGLNRHNIITLKGGFHGRTITTLSATGQDSFHVDFQPLTQGFIYIEPSIEVLEKAMNAQNVAALMFEPILGEGGVVPLSREFLQIAQNLAKAKDILLIADEVQTGNGRTGKLYGYMHYDIYPDIVSTAKGLAGGLPMGATLISHKLKDVFQAGMHGSTFGGNPVCSAGALSILSRINDELLQEVDEKSKYIVKELSLVKGVKSISGMGFMLGIECEKSADIIVEECMQKGVLVIKAKDKIRLLPALNIEWSTLKKAIAILAKVCEI